MDPEYLASPFIDCWIYSVHQINSNTSKAFEGKDFNKRGKLDKYFRKIYIARVVDWYANFHGFTGFSYCTSHVLCKITVEPPDKGHYGANDFVPCGEVVPISEVK